MIHRDINQLPYLTETVQYIDEITLEVRNARVVCVENIEPTLAFVYLASFNEEENIHQDFGVRYRDIMVFDNLPNENPDGSYKDSVLGMYGKTIGENN